VRELRKAYPSLDIGVDGGVGPKTIKYCAEAGERPKNYIIMIMVSLHFTQN